MGKATSMVHRERVVSLKKEGHSYQSIGDQLGLSRSNVRDICTRYGRQGKLGLATAYANCGPKEPKSPPLRRAALWLKRLPPGLGHAPDPLRAAQPLRSTTLFRILAGK